MSGKSKQDLDDFVRESTDNLFKKLPLLKRLAGLSPEQRLEGLSAQDIAEALSPEALEALVRQAQHQRPFREPAESRPLSLMEALLRFAQEHDRQRAKRRSLLIYEVLRAQGQDADPSELSKQELDEMLDESINDALEWFSPKERLEGLSPRERLQGLSVEDVVQAISPQALAVLVRRFIGSGPSLKSQ